jgi:hypothetical protein
MNATDFRAAAEVFSQVLSLSSSVLTFRLSDAMDLDGLHIRRDKFHEEHDRLIKIASVVAEPEWSIAAIDREITDLVAAEGGDIQRRADQGGHGEPLPLLVRKRQKRERTRRLQRPIYDRLLRGATVLRGGHRTSARTFLSMLLRLLPALTRGSRKVCAAITRSQHRARERADQCGRASGGRSRRAEVHCQQLRSKIPSALRTMSLVDPLPSDRKKWREILRDTQNLSIRIR